MSIGQHIAKTDVFIHGNPHGPRPDVVGALVLHQQLGGQQTDDLPPVRPLLSRQAGAELLIECLAIPLSDGLGLYGVKHMVCLPAQSALFGFDFKTWRSFRTRGVMAQR
jgi:hypothetical protein